MVLHDCSYSANALKARLLLALLDVDCERREVDLFAGDTLTDAYGRLNPVREVPVLELDDGATVTQSNAVLTYLADGTPLLPGDRLGRAQVVQWLSFEQERVMGTIGGLRLRLVTERPDPRADERRAGAEVALAVLDGHLAGRDWLVGDAPTIADLSVFAYAHLAPEAGVDLAPHRAVLAWLDRTATLVGAANDLAPYPPHARPGLSRSIYD